MKYEIVWIKVHIILLDLFFFFTIRSVVGEINESNFDWYFDPDN